MQQGQLFHMTCNNRLEGYVVQEIKREYSEVTAELEKMKEEQKQAMEKIFQVNRMGEVKEKRKRRGPE